MRLTTDEFAYYIYIFLFASLLTLIIVSNLFDVLN